MKNHFKLKREEAGTVIGPAIRYPCAKKSFSSIAETKGR
jgi:hypothetical protein